MRMAAGAARRSRRHTAAGYGRRRPRWRWGGNSEAHPRRRYGQARSCAFLNVELTSRSDRYSERREMRSLDRGRSHRPPLGPPESGPHMGSASGRPPCAFLVSWWESFVDDLTGRRQFARRKVLVDRYALAGGTPNLEIVGRRWVNRGPSYWSRRIAWSVVWLWCAFVGAVPAIAVTAKLAVSPLPLGAGIAIGVIWWVAAVPAFVFPYRRLAVFPSARALISLSLFPGSRFKPPAILCWPVLAGMCAAIFLSTLRRDFPGEAAAREAHEVRQDQIRSRRSLRR